MDLSNKDEVLSESLKVIDVAYKSLSDKGVSISVNIKDILEMCVKYGFEQGALHAEYASNQRLLDFYKRTRIDGEPTKPC